MVPVVGVRVELMVRLPNSLGDGALRVCGWMMGNCCLLWRWKWVGVGSACGVGCSCGNMYEGEGAADGNTGVGCVGCGGGWDGCTNVQVEGVP